MSAWAAVLEDVASRGGTPAQVANRLGLPRPLVQAVLDHAERLGVVAVAGRGCGSGGYGTGGYGTAGCGSACAGGPAIPPGCAGCLLTRSMVSQDA